MKTKNVAIETWAERYMTFGNRELMANMLLDEC
jgi:hypothetical protein